jgi:hypothetical protein
MVFKYSPGANAPFPLLRWPEIGVEAGVFSDPTLVDQHVLGVNTQSCGFSEIYKLYPVGSQANPPISCGACNSQSGVKYNGDSYALNGGVDAAGMYVSPVSLRYSELKSCSLGRGPISHALRFTMANGFLAGSNVWPATAFTNEPGSLPYGFRIRLKSSFNINAFSPTAQCVLRAMQNYGAFMADGGTNMAFQTMADATGDYTLFNALREITLAHATLNSDQFEIVDESTLEDTNRSSPTYQSGRVNPSNPYVTPDHFVSVIATNGSSESSTIPVILQPITIGVDRAVGYSFMAGAPATQLNVWVNGSTVATFSCTMSPSVGTLTSDGLYTPPATSMTRQTTQVTCTATADNSQSVLFPIFVYPQAAIRESLSEDTNVDFTDANGNVWYAGIGAFYRLPGAANCDFGYLPGSPWPPLPSIGLYYHCEYGSMDARYRFFVPNGTYSITLMFGIGGTTPFPRGMWVQGIDAQGLVYSGSNATNITAQGPAAFFGIQGKQVDLCDIVGSCANATPGQVTLITTVTNNEIYFALRPTKIAVLTAFSIIPNPAFSIISSPGKVKPTRP